jgi:hypothetical protein
VKIRFYLDPVTGLPHIYNHNVDEAEIEQVLANSNEDRPGSENSRVAIGPTDAGESCVSSIFAIRSPIAYS